MLADGAVIECVCFPQQQLQLMGLNKVVTLDRHIVLAVPPETRAAVSSQILLVKKMTLREFQPNCDAP